MGIPLRNRAGFDRDRNDFTAEAHKGFGVSELLLILFHLLGRQGAKVLLTGADDKKCSRNDVKDSATIIPYGSVKFEPVDFAFFIADNESVIVQTESTVFVVVAAALLVG